MYMGFLPALLPLIVANLRLDYKAAGALVSIVTLTSQFSQPFLGFLGDRAGRRPFAIFAPVLTAICMSLIGFASGYSTLLAVLILGSLGNAAFHPQGAGLVGTIVRDRASFAMAAFTTGGSIGYGVGSLLIAAIVASFGISLAWIAVPVGFASAVFVATAIPRSAEPHRAASASIVSAASRRWLIPFGILFLVMMLRAATATMFTTFVPLLIARRGEALILGGWALLGFSLAGAVGGLAGGSLAERLGRRAVTIAGLALVAPALYLFLHTGGIVSAVLLFITGACLMSALPVNIVMGQDLFPGHASTVSGITMGVAWGVGGLGAAALGALADHWSASMGDLAGLSRALDLIALLPLAAALLAIALPDTRALRSQDQSPAA